MTFHRASILLFAPLVTALQTAAGQSRAAVVPDSLWHWFVGCSAPESLTVDLRLDTKPLYRIAFPICRATSPATDAHQPLVFKFVGSPRRFADDPVVGLRSIDSIEGNVWQAGAESDGVILGVSLMTKQQIVLNTLHFASADTACTSVLDSGLVIVTRPSRRRASRTPPN